MPSILAGNDAPPLDPSSVLADLTALQSAHDRSTEARRREAVDVIQPAAQSGAAATRLYEDAVEGTGHRDMSDWKKRNADLLRAKAFQESLQLRLRYLLLSIERGRSPDAASRWAAPSLQYAGDLARLLTDKSFLAGPKEARDMLQAPLGDGPIVRWLRVSSLLPPADIWEQVPGNLGGILEKNVRAPWRADGDPRLDAAWQLELETGAALATALDSDRAAEDFNTRTAASLLFQRARDRAATGQPNRAAADILELARRYPEHPDFPQWAATLREMLQKKTISSPSP